MRIANWLDQFAIFTGHSIKWLAIIMLLVQFGIVISRYAFGINSIALQELVLYLHASLFMVAAAYTLQVDGHVRVDIFLFALHTEKQSLDRYSRARNFFCCLQCWLSFIFLGPVCATPGQSRKVQFRWVVCPQVSC